MNLISSELLKYKRGFLAKLVTFIPIFFAAYAVVIHIILTNNAQAAKSADTASGWNVFLALVFNWWPFLFLPLGMGLFAGLAALQEKKSGNYQLQRSCNISPFQIWVGKICGMAFLSFLSALVLIASAAAGGLLTGKGIPPLGQIIFASLLCWLASLALIPIQLWIASAGGILASLGLSFAGAFAGVLAAPTPYWIICPWSYATRLMCPVIGVHPNGVLLASGAPLTDSSVILRGIFASAVVLSFAACLSGFWFGRKEWK